jgi:hypothetical protein
VAVCLSGCAGYRLGDVKPYTARNVKTIAIKTFTNNTYTPRVEVLITNTIVKQIQQDGTYRITTEDSADAVLDGVVLGIGRNPARAVRGNVLATSEFNLGVTVGYTLRLKDGTAIAGPGTLVAAQASSSATTSPRTNARRFRSRSKISRCVWLAS